METSSPLTKKSLNLLQGDIISTLTRLALPIMASALIQMAYNLVDTAWIGRLGYRSVAAVGAAGMFIWFGDGLLLLSRIGGQVYLGQNLGRGDFAAAQKTVRAALQLTAGISLTYTILQFVFTPRLVAFFPLYRSIHHTASRNLFAAGRSRVFLFVHHSRIHQSGNGRRTQQNQYVRNHNRSAAQFCS